MTRFHGEILSEPPPFSSSALSVTLWWGFFQAIQNSVVHDFRFCVSWITGPALSFEKKRERVKSCFWGGGAPGILRITRCSDISFNQTIFDQALESEAEIFASIVRRLVSFLFFGYNATHEAAML